MSKIGLFDHMGWGNLGDAATQDAVIRALKLRRSDAQIVLFSLNPEDSASRHGLPALPINSSGTPASAKPIGAVADPEAPAGHAETPAGHAETAAPDSAILEWLRRSKERFRGVRGFDLLAVAQWRARRQLTFLARSYRRLQGFDTLVISGGGQMDDTWGGPMAAPLNLLTWAVLARATKTRLVFLSVGAGPLRSSLSRTLVKQALSRADFRSYRDEESRRFVLGLGLGAAATDAVYPDLAFSLPIDPGPLAVVPAEPPVVGIGPIPYMDPRFWPQPAPASYQNYVEQLARFVVWLVTRGHPVRFLLGEIHMDKAAVHDIREAATRRVSSASADLIVEAPIASVGDLMAELAKTDIVVSSRFHGVLLAQALARPVIALSYHQKIDSLMRDMGQGDHRLPIDGFDSEALTRVFLRVEAGLPEIKARLIARAREHREALSRVYDQIFSAGVSAGPAPEASAERVIAGATLPNGDAPAC